MGEREDPPSSAEEQSVAAVPSGALRTLRAQLQRLTLATLLPVLILSMVGAWVLSQREEAAFEQGARARVRAMATAVDSELQSVVGTLRALATSNELESDPLAGFHDRMVRVLRTQPDWWTIVLSSPSGQQLLDALAPIGTPLALVADRESLERVVSSGQPTIGNIDKGTSTGRPRFTVRVPIKRGDTVAYALTAIVKPQLISDILASQQIPVDWTAAIVDGSNHFVVRTIDSEHSVGQLVSRDLQRALGTSTEGWFEGKTLEGTVTYTAFLRAPKSGWSVAIAIPRSFVGRVVRPTVFALGIVTAAALALAVLLASAVGRSISRPIGALAEAARSIAQGRRVALAPTQRLRELSELAHAMDEAGAAVQSRDDTQRKLSTAMHSLQAADRAKDEFLAILAHELRNPLAAITNSLALLARLRGDEPGARDARARIERQTRQLVRLVDDILDVSRITQGRLELKKGSVEVSSVVAQAVETSKAQIEAAGHSLAIHLPVEAVRLDADAVRLTQVLNNLLNNAAKYAERPGAITMTVEAEAHALSIKVRDTGIGLSAEMLPRIFEMFTRAPQAPHRATEGLGVGLSLAKRLVELHGGTLTAKSDGLGLGSEFIVRLPRASGSVGSQSEVGPPSSALTDRRVLVVDDNRDAAASLAALLEATGNQTRIAYDGEEAVSAALEYRPDAIILDIGLPKMNGYDACRAIRRDAHGKDVLIVALSGWGQPEDRRKSTEAGFDLHLVKPVDFAVLTQALSKVRAPA